MLDAAHEARAPVLVACTPPFAAEPPNKRILVFAVENGPPRKCSQFSGANRFSRCRLHADIYEPIVDYLGIAGGIVKRATTIGQALNSIARFWRARGRLPPRCFSPAQGPVKLEASVWSGTVA